jgi:hypothetical protein
LGEGERGTRKILGKKDGTKRVKGGLQTNLIEPPETPFSFREPPEKDSYASLILLF